MSPKNPRQDIQRIIERRHPHLLPLDSTDVHTFSEAQTASRAPSAADRQAIEEMWRRGCVVLLLAGAARDLAYWTANATLNSPNRILVVLSESRRTLFDSMGCLHKEGLLNRPGLYWVETEQLHEQLNTVFEKNSLILFNPDAISCHFASGTSQAQRSQWEREITASVHDYMSRRQAHNQRFALLKTDLPANFRVWSFALGGEGSMGMYIHGSMLIALSEGFRQIGAEAETCCVEPDDPAIPYRLLDSLTRYRPSVFLSLNTPPVEAYSYFLDSKAAQSLPQNRLVWLVDHPRFYAGRGFDERDWVWACDKAYVQAAEEMGARRVFVAPLAADLPRDGVVRDEYHCKVLFVGKYQDTSTFLDAMAPRTREHVEQLIDRILAGEDIITNNPSAEGIPREDLEKSRPVFEEFCLRLNKKFSKDDTKLLLVASVTAGSRKRAEAVRSLLPFGVHVYGNEAWSSVLGEQTKEVFKGFAARPHVPDIYASADIVLNCHSPQLPNALNPRDFNVLRAGGCLVSDWVTEMESGVLEPGRDLVCYRSTEELVSEVERLLSHEDERKALAQTAHQTVLDRHLYRHRAEWIRSWLA